MSRPPDAATWSERLAGLPNTLGMLIAGALFVGGVLLLTVPYEVTAPDGATTACGSVLFELVVPSDGGKVPADADCREQAGGRLVLGLAGIGIGVVGGVATRQIRKRRYDPRRLDLIDARAR